MAGTQSIATAYVQILPSTQGIGAGLAGALSGIGGASLVAAGGMGTAAGVASMLAKKLNLTNISAVGAAAALIEFGKSSVRTGMNFDAAMSQVYALMSSTNDGAGLTAEEMTTLRDRAREMGASTQFTAEQVADAMSYMALAGWDAQEVYDNIPAVLQLAAASSMDLSRASDIVTDYMAAFSNTAPTAIELVDLLAYAQSRSNATTSQFAEAWKYSAGMMNTAGQSAETTTAILARLADQGHKGSTAGVELNAIMTELVKGMDAAGNVKLNGMTIPLKDAEGNFRNMIDVFADMQTALGGLSEADAQEVSAYIAAVDDAFKDADLDDPATAQAYREAMEAIADPAQGASPGSIAYMQDLLGLFDNVRSLRGIAAVLNGDVQGIKDFESALYESNGTAASMATTVNDNLAGDLKIFNSAVDDVKISVSDGLTPALRTATQVATGFVQKFGRLLKGETPTDNSITSLTDTFGNLSDFDYENLGARAEAMMRKLQSPDLEEDERAELVAGLQQIRDAVSGTALTESGENAIRGLASGMTSYNFTGDAQSVKDNIISTIDDALIAHSPARAMIPSGENAAAGIGVGMTQYDFSTDGLTAVAAIQAAINAALAIADWTIPAGLIGSGIARGINARRAPVITAAAGLVTAAKSRMSSLIGPSGSKFVPIGEDIAKGMAKGIRDGSSYVLKAIQDLIDAALKGAAKDIERGSPSHLFAREIGAPISQGVGMGIRDAMGDPISALSDTMDALSDVTAAEFMGEGSMPARGGYVFNQTVNSPRALSPWEVARQARNATRQMAEAMA